jgi:ribose transport system permease protein
MGVLIIGILNNGLILMGVNSNWQGVIKGLVLIAAVGIDNVQRKAKKARIAAA